MTEKPIVIIDCRQDYKYPKRKPRIYPRSITMNLNEEVNLYLRTTPPLCDPACYTWEILRGGGYLIGNFGVENIYYAPTDNELCEANPHIAVSCMGKLLDKISIGITGLPKPVPALLKILKWEQPEFELATLYPHLVGMSYCDKDPRVHYWTIRIDEYGCDGSRIQRWKIGVVSLLVEALCGIKIYTDRFRKLRIYDETVLVYGYDVWASLDRAKTVRLNDWGYEYRYAFQKILRTRFNIIMKEWPKELLAPFNPGQTVDARVKEVIEMDCCPYLLAERLLLEM